MRGSTRFPRRGTLGFGCRLGRRLRAVQALAARHHVIIERAARGSRIAARDLVDDAAMLARRDRKRAALRKRRAAKEMKLVHQSAVGDKELRIADELDHSIVKGDIRREV